VPVFQSKIHPPVEIDFPAGFAAKFLTIFVHFSGRFQIVIAGDPLPAVPEGNEGSGDKRYPEGRR
jgi:hypothetical protein